MLVSPGIDAERNFLLNVLGKLQSIAMIVCPNARIVPAPPWDKCTNVPELVCIVSRLIAANLLCLCIDVLHLCAIKLL